MADRFRARQDEAQQGLPSGPPAGPQAADGAPVDHAAEQTQLLRDIASNVATLRSIAVFFTVLWGIGALIVLISVFAR